MEPALAQQDALEPTANLVVSKIRGLNQGLDRESEISFSLIVEHS